MSARVGHLVQRLGAEVGDVVAGRVAARVEGDPRGAAEEARFFLGLDVFGPGEEPPAGIPAAMNAPWSERPSKAAGRVARPWEAK